MPSPKVPTYDLKPEMSAAGIADTVINAIEKGDFDAIIMNFANADMVGHSGKLEATIKAVETVDECLGRILSGAAAARRRVDHHRRSRQRRNHDRSASPAARTPITPRIRCHSFWSAMTMRVAAARRRLAARHRADDARNARAMPARGNDRARSAHSRSVGRRKPPCEPPRETTLTICVWHPFTLWRAPEWRRNASWIAGRRCACFTCRATMNCSALPQTDILVGFSLRPEQFATAKKLKWIHATAAGVGQLMYPALRRSGVVVTNARGILRPAWPSTPWA